MTDKKPAGLPKLNSSKYKDIDLNLENLLKRSIQNIKDDRSTTFLLLFELQQYIMANKERHKEAGLVAAKYLETMQRSNEQLVKIASILQKENDINSTSFSTEEKENLLDEINESKKK